MDDDATYEEYLDFSQKYPCKQVYQTCQLNTTTIEEESKALDELAKLRLNDPRCRWVRNKKKFSGKDIGKDAYKKPKCVWAGPFMVSKGLLEHLSTRVVMDSNFDNNKKLLRTALGSRHGSLEDRARDLMRIITTMLLSHPTLTPNTCVTDEERNALKTYGIFDTENNFKPNAFLKWRKTSKATWDDIKTLLTIRYKLWSRTTRDFGHDAQSFYADDPETRAFENSRTPRPKDEPMHPIEPDQLLADYNDEINEGQERKNELETWVHEHGIYGCMKSERHPKKSEIVQCEKNECIEGSKKCKLETIQFENQNKDICVLQNPTNYDKANLDESGKFRCYGSGTFLRKRHALLALLDDVPRKRGEGKERPRDEEKDEFYTSEASEVDDEEKITKWLTSVDIPLEKNVVRQFRDELIGSKAWTEARDLIKKAWSTKYGCFWDRNTNGKCTTTELSRHPPDKKLVRKDPRCDISVSWPVDLRHPSVGCKTLSPRRDLTKTLSLIRDKLTSDPQSLPNIPEDLIHPHCKIKYRDSFKARTHKRKIELLDKIMAHADLRVQADRVAKEIFTCIPNLKKMVVNFQETRTLLETLSSEIGELKRNFSRHNIFTYMRHGSPRLYAHSVHEHALDDKYTNSLFVQTFIFQRNYAGFLDLLMILACSLFDNIMLRVTRYGVMAFGKNGLLLPPDNLEEAETYRFWVEQYRDPRYEYKNLTFQDHHDSNRYHNITIPPNTAIYLPKNKMLQKNHFLLSTDVHLPRADLYLLHAEVLTITNEVHNDVRLVQDLKDTKPDPNTIVRENKTMLMISNVKKTKIPLTDWDPLKKIIKSFNVQRTRSRS